MTSQFAASIGLNGTTQPAITLPTQTPPFILPSYFLFSFPDRKKNRTGLKISCLSKGHIQNDLSCIVWRCLLYTHLFDKREFSRAEKEPRHLRRKGVLRHSILLLEEAVGRRMEQQSGFVLFFFCFCMFLAGQVAKANASVAISSPPLFPHFPSQEESFTLRAYAYPTYDPFFLCFVYFLLRPLCWKP